MSIGKHYIKLIGGTIMSIERNMKYIRDEYDAEVATDKQNYR